VDGMNNSCLIKCRILFCVIDLSQNTLVSKYATNLDLQSSLTLFSDAVVLKL